MIEFQGVSKRFGSKVIFDSLSFDVKPGEVFFVLGKSGAGKSVLLKHLVGLLKPDSGTIRVDGETITDFVREEQWNTVRRKCAMVFQFAALLDSYTIFENLALGLRAHGLCTEAEIPARARESLSAVHLSDRVLSQKPADLSFGMQKRVSIARALALRPRYLLFDEPTTSLDPVTTRTVFDLIRELSQKLQVTALVVSHDMERALEYAERILLLDQGKRVVYGTPDDLRKSSAPLARAFLEDVGSA
jgi:phospholipid/cholesterol/gamma-HCH transport system ATP-binding protein